MGDFVGRFKPDLYNEEMSKVINSDPWNFKPPNGESQADVYNRFVTFLNGTLIPHYEERVLGNSEFNEPHLNVAVFGHALVFKCFIRMLLDLEPKDTHSIPLENTALTLCEFDPHQKLWTIVQQNVIDHLEEAS